MRLALAVAIALCTAARADEAARGKRLFERFCVSCHGERGDGRGYSAKWLEPRPRDFTRGVFKCRSTPTGALPTDDDLLRTLREGLAHTDMPRWAILGERDLRAVLLTVKSFSQRFAEEKVPAPLELPPEPPDTASSRTRGQTLYGELACFNCHGTDGRGEGPQLATLFDDWGRPIPPFDLTRTQRRKCGSDGASLYRTLLGGLAGTPMPAYAGSFSADDGWHLVHYLQSIAPRD
jgi:mono/diheme cytochrome c family protein